jgi:hypothetical protein
VRTITMHHDSRHSRASRAFLYEFRGILDFTRRIGEAP